jgi:amino acid permease
MISWILVLNAFGLVMVYFIVFSETMASVIEDLSSIGKDDEGFEHYLVTQNFWIIVLGLAILPVCLKKEL